MNEYDNEYQEDDENDECVIRENEDTDQIEMSSAWIRLP